MKNAAWKLQNGFANLWIDKRNAIKACADSGQETIWEMSV
jgi:hypothetical protein